MLLLKNVARLIHRCCCLKKWQDRFIDLPGTKLWEDTFIDLIAQNVWQDRFRDLTSQKCGKIGSEILRPKNVARLVHSCYLQDLWEDRFIDLTGTKFREDKLIDLILLTGFPYPKQFKLFFSWVRAHFGGYKMEAPGAREPNQKKFKV